MTNRYYAVTAKCGHVGKNKYIEITFAIKAENGRDAADIARWIPRVKHHQKDAILSVEEVELDDYLQIIEENDQNPYLKCKNVQEQNEFCSDLEILNCDVNEYSFEHDKRISKIKFQKRKYKSIDKELKDYVKASLIDFNYTRAVC